MPTIPRLKPLCAERMEEAERAAVEFLRLCDGIAPRSRAVRASQRPTSVATTRDTVVVARDAVEEVEQLDVAFVELAERQEEMQRYEAMARSAEARATVVPAHRQQHWRSVAERHQRCVDRERAGIMLAAERAARMLSARGVTLADLVLAAEGAALPIGWRVIDGGCA